MKQFLVVVDMQKDFVDGSLGTKEAVAIVPAVVEKIRSFEGEVFVTYDTHFEDYLDSAEGKKLPVPHCIYGTPGWELDAAVGEVVEEIPHYKVQKYTFGSTTLPHLMTEVADGEDFSVELIGLCTDICVVSNALILKAHFPEAPISVDASCCAGVTPALHEGALARAASREKENELLLVNRHPEKAERLRQEIGGTVTDHKTAVREADLIFIGVKPVVLPALCETLKPFFAAREGHYTIVSMVAGVAIERIREMLGVSCPVIRIMPNTPVSVGEGMILYTCSQEVTDGDRNGFLTAMRQAGRFMKVEERLMEAGMAVSGCGPAYVDLFVEALADAAVACGLPRKDALLLSAQMVLGSARLILESGKHPGQLKDEVCSPGGTTIQGVRELEARGFRSAVIEAVIAARNA